VIDLSTKDFKDDTLGSRATQALWTAAVEPPAGVEPAPRSRPTCPSWSRC
jgi:hypothetical protein